MACDGCSPTEDLLARHEAGGGAMLVCPIRCNARELAESTLVGNATLGGTIPLGEWIGDRATTFSH